jgi:hypothetical protein
VPTTR